jgi:hypothetical protein
MFLKPMGLLYILKKHASWSFLIAKKYTNPYITTTTTITTTITTITTTTTMEW